jgi:tRNA(fMet)-specific endonuclease VapC
MIDTNTVSYIIKGRSPGARWRLAGLTGNQAACVSVVTEAEIRYGLAKRPSAKALHAAVDGFLSKIRIHAWGREEALAYGNLRANLEAAGKTLGNLDMLIAAHAIAIGATLVTNDRGLSQVQDLPAAVNWANDLPPQT